ncbi:MAG: helix-turn-helix transcriptional regulator [Lachnospiraceae bacterium]|nr:helix-turn-helix transcriptional regulator [Lachnospiraceae bacterium]
MKFNFGENIKRLRVTKGFTQEKVAELLDISKQSVSRWENNTTYPDISFLPTLASFYCVTVDSLLGVDYETNKKTLEEYSLKRDEAHRLGDVQGAYELSQKMYAIFPNEKLIILNIMSDSYLMGFQDINGKRKYYLEMSISISKRFLELTDVIDEKCHCIKNIATCYKLLENQEKAVEWTKRLPSLWNGVESTSISVMEGREKIDSIQGSLNAVLHLIHRLIYVYAQNTDLTRERRIEILEKLPKIFDVVFENGDYGFYNVFLSRVYVEIARNCQFDSRKGKDALKKAAICAETYDNLGKSLHTSLLFQEQEILPDKFAKANSNSQRENVLELIMHEDFEYLRDFEGFQDIVRCLKR